MKPTKPWWEETWELFADDPESGPVIGLKDGGVLFECNDATRARGAHASPDMARTLLEYRAQHGERCGCPACGFGREALTKAGVPLP